MWTKWEEEGRLWKCESRAGKWRGQWSDKVVNKIGTRKWSENKGKVDREGERKNGWRNTSLH